MGMKPRKKSRVGNDIVFVQMRPTARSRWCAGWWPKNTEGPGYAWVTLKEDAMSWSLVPGKDCRVKRAESAEMIGLFVEENQPQQYESRVVAAT